MRKFVRCKTFLSPYLPNAIQPNTAPDEERATSIVVVVYLYVEKYVAAADVPDGDVPAAKARNFEFEKALGKVTVVAVGEPYPHCNKATREVFSLLLKNSM